MSVSGAISERYDFNVLMRYPVVDIGDTKCVVPLPQLLIWRMYYAPFHELSLAYMSSSGNPFRRFFGSVFHEYVGMLVEDTFGADAIDAEAGPNPPGPVDWLIRVGDCAIAIECRSAEFTMATKFDGGADAIDSDLDRIAVEVVRKFPVKRAALERDASQLGLTGVSRWHLLVVVREPLLPVPLIRERIREKLPSEIEYHLLSIGDLEQMLALHENDGVERILNEKASSKEEMEKDFRSFFHEKSGVYQFRRNKLLDRTFDEFFSGVGVPPAAAG
jgi:hypothetical protein